MSKTFRATIERCFRQSNDGEFSPIPRAARDGLTEAPAVDRRLIYSTKPKMLAFVLGGEAPHEVGVIGHYGLPAEVHAAKIRRLAGGREISFLGDLDPPDLLVFAWLRDRLGPRSIRYFGPNDRLLAALGIESDDWRWIRCDQNERRALRLVKRKLPDWRELIGSRCAHRLAAGRKIELEGVVLHHADRAPLIAALGA